MLRIQEEFKILMLTTIVLASPYALGQSVAGKIQRIGDATHIEFKGLKSWNYEVKKNKDGTVEVVVPAFDELTEVNLRTWQGPHIKSAKIDKAGPDNRYLVRFELDSQNVEIFDYLTDDPSRLIIDFYKQTNTKKKTVEKVSSKALPEKKSAQKLTKPKPKNQAKYGSRYKKLDRKPAGGELIANPKKPEVFVPPSDQYPRRGVFDAGDASYKRFSLKDYQIKEEAIIASKQNIYLKFPLLQLPFNRFEEIFKDKPEYEIMEKKSEQNKEARLILTLYKRKRFATFNKVYNFYVKKHKDTPYDEILHNLAAEMHVENYLKTNDQIDLNRFQALYKMLNERFSKSQLLERNRLLLAYSSLVAKQSTEALRLLENYQRQYPKSKEMDYVRLATAESYVLLNKPKEATQILRQIEKNPIDKARGIEAAYRLGDVSAIFEKFKDAQKRYAEAMEKYPEFKKIFPNASYNLAESEFWTEKYKKSLGSYIEFLKIFPNHDHGGYAITRIGELLEILGADRSQIMGAFVEGYFRFPKNPGSEVARVRMLSQSLKGMKEKQKDIAIKEIEEITNRSPLDRMDEFSALMVSEGLAKNGENRRALSGLLEYYQSNPTKAKKEVFKGRILRNISSVLKKETEGNDFIEALNFYGKYSTTWLKNSERLDAEFYKSVAYEKAGVFDEAAKGYSKIVKKLKRISGTKEEKQRKVYEYLPNVDEVLLRISAVALAEKKYQKAYRNLASISGQLKDKQEVERVKIGADVAIATGDKAKAVGYLQKLIDNWTGDSALLAEPYLKLGQIYLGFKRLEKTNTAIGFIENLKLKDSVSDDIWSQTLELKANYQIAQGQKLAAVQTYVRLLDEFKGKRPMESTRYKAGLLLFEDGDIKGAEKLWSALKEEPTGFYKRLAKEKLSQVEWDESYRKYLDRIPAAQ